MKKQNNPSVLHGRKSAQMHGPQIQTLCENSCSRPAGLARLIGATVPAVCAMLFTCSSLPSAAQTILQQDFNGAGGVAAYVTGTPNAGQFDAIVGNGGLSVSLMDVGYDKGNSLVLDRSGGAGTGALARTTDMTEQPGAVKIEFWFTPGFFVSAAESAVTFQVGSNFSTPASVESSAQAAASVSVDLKPFASTFGYDWWGWTGSSDSFAGYQGDGFPRVTWVVNNRNSSINYVNPNKDNVTLGPKQYDLWMGDSGLAVKVFEGVVVANPAVPLTDFKVVISGGQAMYAIDDLKIEDLAPFADVQAAIVGLQSPQVGAGQVTIPAVGTPNSHWTVWRAPSPSGPWTNSGSLLLDGSGHGQQLDPDPPPQSAFYRLEGDGAGLPAHGLTLGEALDASELNWTTGGGTPWFAQTNETYDGDAAAQAGTVLDEQETWIETEVMGPGRLSFWWKVSSQFSDFSIDSGDFLMFYVNDFRVWEISGERGWDEITFDVPSGPHVLRWSYRKSYDTSEGADTGWVDRVKFTASNP